MNLLILIGVLIVLGICLSAVYRARVQRIVVEAADRKAIIVHSVDSKPCNTCGALVLWELHERQQLEKMYGKEVEADKILS